MGLYSVNQIDMKKYVGFQWKKGQTGQVVFKAPDVRGVYEIRAFRGKSRKQYYSPIAISNKIHVK